MANWRAGFLLCVVVASFATSNTAQTLDPFGIVTCATCHWIFETIVPPIIENRPPLEVIALMVDVCTTVNVVSAIECEFLMEAYYPHVRYIVLHGNVTADRVCAIAVQPQDCNPGSEDLEFSIDLSVYGPKPPSQVQELPEEGSPVVRAVHITDLHIDPFYEIGSFAECESVYCCRDIFGYTDNETIAAGAWGDYHNCDISYDVLRSSLEHAASQNPEFVIMTGDFIHHSVATTSKIGNANIFMEVSQLMKEVFGDIPVFPILGNHETHPLNMFPPPEVEDPNVSAAWLYDLAVQEWSDWIPLENLELMRYGGYYWTSLRPGLRIIGLNTNFGYIGNWWTLYDWTDTGDQLESLGAFLYDAEQAGDKAILIGHSAPGGGDAWAIWSREYNRILDRFDSTIAAQFFGHTHKDAFKLRFAEDNATVPAGVYFTGGSVTTWTKLNPSYRVVTLDGARPNGTWEVLNFETWIYNITEANAAPDESPEWFKLYDMKDAFGLDSLRPDALFQLFSTFLGDEEAFQKYYYYYVKGGDWLVEEGCVDDEEEDTTCKTDVLCEIVTADYGDQSHCETLVKPQELDHY